MKKTIALQGNSRLKTKTLFTTSEKVQRFRSDLENSTQEKFKEIDKNRSLTIEELHKRYL